jgi:hypothetical protein
MVATLLGPGEVEPLAQDVEESGADVHVETPLLSVHGEDDLHPSMIAHCH